MTLPLATPLKVLVSDGTHLVQSFLFHNYLAYSAWLHANRRYQCPTLLQVRPLVGAYS